MKSFAASAAVLLVAPFLGAGGNADAAPTAITLGELATPVNVSCVGGGTLIQGATAAGGASYRVPERGVITSFSTRTNLETDQTARLALFGPPTANTFPVMATSATFPMLSASVNTFDVRVPVQPGWLLGVKFTVPGNGGCAHNTGVAADDLYSVSGGSIDGPAVVAANAGNFHLNLSAVFEPDTDGDGYGDVSQDACPESALAVVACPAPDTSITKAPKKKSKKRSVTVAFGSTLAHSTFLVGVDGKPAQEYLSPYRAKLKPGKHTITVQAVSPLGIVDASPATTSFTIKKAKRHH